MINESLTSGNALHTTHLLLNLLTIKQDDSKFAQLLQEHTDQWEITSDGHGQTPDSLLESGVGHG